MPAQGPRLGAHPAAPPAGLERRLGALLEHDRLALLGLLAIAAVTRLPGLATRGRWEGDQGDHLMTLWRWTQDGVIPLVGSPAANNAIHHGAGHYFYLLAPVAFLSGTDPGALVWVMAAFGIATVAVTWWLASEVGGRLAGLVAGLFMAVSPAGIEASTFLWNANLVPFFAGLAAACAWHAHATRRARWWVVALASAGMALQLHLLGGILLPAIVTLLAADVWRARREAGRGDVDRSRGLLLAGLAGAGLIALLFLPLVVSELQTGFQETQRLVAYLGGPGEAEETTQSPLARLLVIVLRIIGWPLVGLITQVPTAATVAAALVIGLAAWRAVKARGDEAVAVRWLAGTLAWSSVALTFAAPTLQSVVPGLPNDHYHAFLDPIVIVLLAVGAAGLAKPRTEAAPATGLAGPSPGVDAPTREAASVGPGPAPGPVLPDRLVRGMLALGVVAIFAAAVTRWPPAVDPNGGWPAAQMAGVRIVETTERAPTAFLGLPRFETPDGVVFPFVYAGGTRTDDPADAEFIVVPCNRLFERVLEAPCGGPAEDRLMGELAAGSVDPFLKPDGPPYPALERVPQLVVRFDLSPRTSISIYRIG